MLPTSRGRCSWPRYSLAVHDIAEVMVPSHRSSTRWWLPHCIEAQLLRTIWEDTGPLPDAVEVCCPPFDQDRRFVVFEPICTYQTGRSVIPNRYDSAGAVDDQAGYRARWQVATLEVLDTFRVPCVTVSIINATDSGPV